MGNFSQFEHERSLTAGVGTFRVNGAMSRALLSGVGNLLECKNIVKL